jgi:preprotein translocase subunit SecD
MARRNTLVFMIVLTIFILALFVLFPIEKGKLLGRGIRLGLDLQGGTRIVYQADLSAVQPSDAAGAIDGAIAVLENRINPMGVTDQFVFSGEYLCHHRQSG